MNAKQIKVGDIVERGLTHYRGIVEEYLVAKRRVFDERKQQMVRRP